MTTRLSRERARTSALDHLHTRATELARFASNPATATAPNDGHAVDASHVSTTDATPSPTRAGRLHTRRAHVARWRRNGVAMWALLFAGLGSATIVGGAAIADSDSAPNSVRAFGAAPVLSTAFRTPLREGVVGISGDPRGRGYWLVASDGGVFTFGHTEFFGSMGAQRLNAPIVGIASTPSGRGYWLVGADGGVFAYGDASFEGSMVGVPLAAPIISIVPTHDGDGYWLVGADGGVFAFGNARFHGSAESLTLASPIAGAAATKSGHGYWLVGADGGVFAYGDANFHGSQPNPEHHAVGIAAAPGQGYWIAYADGSVRGFDAPLPGNAASTLDPSGVHANTVAIAPSARGGYWLAQGAVDPASLLVNDPFLACTRAHESSGAGGYRAVSAGGTYRGAYQFDRGTWNSASRLAGRDDLVGADPSTVAPPDQDLVAMALYKSRGTQPWGGRCGGL